MVHKLLSKSKSLQMLSSTAQDQPVGPSRSRTDVPPLRSKGSLSTLATRIGSNLLRPRQSSSNLLNATSRLAPLGGLERGAAIEDMVQRLYVREPSNAFRFEVKRAEATPFFQNSADRARWLEELAEYRHYSLSKLKVGQQPASFSAQKDIALASGVIAMLNAKHPGLNLRRARTPQDFVKHVRLLEETHAKLGCEELLPAKSMVLVRLSKLHHAIAEVEIGLDRKASVTFIDSAPGDGEGVQESLAALNAALGEAPHLPVTYVVSGAQRSPADCLVFGLCNAVAAHRQGLAEKIRQGVDTGALALEQAGKFPRVACLMPEPARLPAVLFANAHSGRVFQAMPASDEANELEARNALHEVQRDKRAYSAAIEAERVHLLGDTAQHLNGFVSDEQMRQAIAEVWV